MLNYTYYTFDLKQAHNHSHCFFYNAIYLFRNQMTVFKTNLIWWVSSLKSDCRKQFERIKKCWCLKSNPGRQESHPLDHIALYEVHCRVNNMMVINVWYKRLKFLNYRVVIIVELYMKQALTTDTASLKIKLTF